MVNGDQYISRPDKLPWGPVDRAEPDFGKANADAKKGRMMRPLSAIYFNP